MASSLIPGFCGRSLNSSRALVTSVAYWVLDHVSPEPVDDLEVPPVNAVMFQSFEWYLPASSPSSPSQSHWSRLGDLLPRLSALGISTVWIPPACKAWHASTSNGYDIYDLFDLGEFDQKGSRATKWGTRAELEMLAQKGQEVGVGLLFDVVVNHKAAADFLEEGGIGTRVDEKDRRKEIGPPEEIDTWTGFSFPNRGDTHSSFKWHREHFSGVDYDNRTKKNGIWKLDGKEWAPDVDKELGNYDYLMFANIDHAHPGVNQEIKDWLSWLHNTAIPPLSAVRLDAIKHISASAIQKYVDHLTELKGPEYPIVGEYLVANVEKLSKHIARTGNRIHLFDFALLENFYRISQVQAQAQAQLRSRALGRLDLRSMLRGSLAERNPDRAVTFVHNHDTQPGQPCEKVIGEWFVSLAYATILLHSNAGRWPCVFWCDLFGTHGPTIPTKQWKGGENEEKQKEGNWTAPMASIRTLLPKLLVLRKLYAYGKLTDHVAGSRDPHCVGFTRRGHPGRSGGDGMAVLMCATPRRHDQRKQEAQKQNEKKKRMFVGRRHAGERWTDALGTTAGPVMIDWLGWGTFRVTARTTGEMLGSCEGGLSVWVREGAEGRDVVDACTSLS